MVFASACGGPANPGSCNVGVIAEKENRNIIDLEQENTLSTQLHSVPPATYVDAINKQVGKTFPDLASKLVSYEVTGSGLEQRTHLHVPQAALQAVMEVIYDLRQEGLFCFPVLAPLDAHTLL